MSGTNRLLMAGCMLLGVAQTGHTQTYGNSYSSSYLPPDHIRYLSARCRSLYDAMQGAQARGLGQDTRMSMQREYRTQCADDEKQAMNQAWQDKREKQSLKMEAQKAEKLEKERNVQASNTRTEQCRESKRILTTKRARTDLTPGEKADLDRFEENFRARCL